MHSRGWMLRYSRGKLIYSSLAMQCLTPCFSISGVCLLYPGIGGNHCPKADRPLTLSITPKCCIKYCSDMRQYKSLQHVCVFATVQQAFTYKGHNIYKYSVDYDMMAANMNSLA